MAVLTAPDRATVRHDFSLDLARDPIALTKPELLAAVAAVDTWLDDNASAFNTAIPQPARTVLTVKQKARLLVSVVRRRFEVA